jgi:SAM-dependent methyltransferase
MIGDPWRLPRRVVPAALRQRLHLRARWQAHALWPAVGWVRFGSLRRVEPISRNWGFDRGLPVDRYYIARFLERHAQCVLGRVLEIADNTYTREFGGADVTRSDVLHVAGGNPRATIVGDLAYAPHIVSESFDCIILTQTFQLIYDVRAAIRTIHRILKPGGVVLATFPGISQISRYDADRWGYYWSFTTLSAQRLFEECFPAENVHVQAHGNVLAAIALLHGLACQELRPSELNYFDPDYEVLITVSARKPPATPGAQRTARR